MQEVQKFLARNGEDITLRQALPEDAERIINVIRTTSPERSYILMEQYGKDAESERKYISEIDRKNNLLLIAIAKNNVVGSLASLQADSGYRPQTAHILNIGLHIIENYRGIGIGSQMLKYSIEWARERGFKKMMASIFTTNKRSLHLFSKAGFTEECVRRKQIRIGHEYIDEMCMSLFFE